MTRGKTCLALALSTAVIVACSGGSGSPSEGRPALVVGSACPRPETTRVALQGRGDSPVCVEGSWVFTVPAEEGGPSPDRTELFLTQDGGPLVGHEGETVVHDVDLTTHLGPAGASDRDWHVVWQLHGPTQGEWRPPPVGLRIRNGILAVSGGAGWPGHDWKNANHEWVRDLGRIEDGRTYHVRVEVFLSSDPNGAWVSAVMNGHQVAHHWRPVSPDGYSVGTIYPGQPEVASRIGLYRGTQGGRAPDYDQVVVQKVREATAH